MTDDPGRFAVLRHPGFRSLILCTIVLCAANCIYLSLRLPLGVPGEWESTYHETLAPMLSVLVLALVMSGFLWAAFFLGRVVSGASVLRNALTLLVLTPLYGLLLYASACTGPFGRAEFIAPASQHGASGLFRDEANRIGPGLKYESAGAYLGAFPAILREYANDYDSTVRINNNPPGTTMLFLAARRAAERVPGLGVLAAELAFGRGAEPAHLTQAQTLIGVWALLVGAALAFIPAFLIASTLAGRASPAAAAVAMLAGSLLLFVPGKDSFQVQFFLWMQWFFLASTRKRPILCGLLYGAAAVAGFFFTLAIAVLVVAHLVYSLWSLARSDRRSRRRALLFWASSAVGLVAGFLLLYVTTGYNAAATLVQCYRNHSGFYAAYERTYWKWLIYGPWEYVMFMGAPLATAAIWAMVRWRKTLTGSPQARAAFMSLASITAVMAVLILLGKNMGEVNRLFIFFQPLLALPACALIASGATGNLAALPQHGCAAPRVSSRAVEDLGEAGHGPMMLLSIAILQGACVIALQLFIDIWRSEGLFVDIMKLVEAQ